MWLKLCSSSDYEKINIINEKIISRGKEGVKAFLDKVKATTEDTINQQLIPELPYEEPTRAGIIPMPRVNRIKRKKNINQY